MTELMQVCKCLICGNVVEVLHTGKGQLVCCGKPMELLKENTVDASREKHVPVISKKDGKVNVQVGSAKHPMEEKHFIEWVEVLSAGRVFRQFLAPGNNPAVQFETDGENISARAYCNIHGLWRSGS
ncbi:desulfoferrodoxin [Pelotomaculum terephthalicicum JT]|uniref:desulfoferrodoxin n=1 Tax=Pelotomaculum TaxID=191373 RepID=UPI0009C62A19|nr:MULTISPECIES: desulfoferrodoxin [Pelotomaculum]MCG9968485.1 desulfoferrodoxin [Pelotomaculum terephthalicicum JT]OPX88908.1 MAG: Desulfoferrodoxin [Pelotomaculum sp. PtaB.Bin117]OPY60276.1 MAG: Desulfoferrodoxin [Pelotomaculum sp. PtaU1.Bin065]